MSAQAAQIDLEPERGRDEDDERHEGRPADEERRHGDDGERRDHDRGDVERRLQPGQVVAGHERDAEADLRRREQAEPRVERDPRAGHEREHAARGAEHRGDLGEILVTHRRSLPDLARTARKDRSRAG